MNEPITSIKFSRDQVISVVENTLDFIAKKQLDNGAIPWFDQGKLDPWDHTEALIALSIGKKFDAVKKGFIWLSNHQNPDGSWFTKYYGPSDKQDFDRKKIETNFVAYPATGLWAYYLASNDVSFVKDLFPCIQAALNYVVSLQNSEGDIQWAQSQVETLPKDALVTACASTLRSLECGIFLADICNENSAHWEESYSKLADALKNKPWRFDRTWESKDRFSMDWFYPILSGIYSEDEARLRLEHDWEKFIEPGFGCRCVSDEPWVTVAETCELIISLVAANKKNKAEEIFLNLLRWQDIDGGFWTGYVLKNNTIWPEEKTSWTAAAIIMAADALYNLSPVSSLFCSPSHIYYS